jgi:hypothetical protein
VVLVAGFGGLLLIMAAAEAGALLFLNSLRHNDTTLQARFLARNRTLERIRSDIYLSGTFVRDSLLAPEQSGARAQLATLEGLRRDSESALTSYAAALEPEEAAPFQDLRSQIEAYWNVLDRTLAWNGEERGKYRDAFFYEELVPRRTSMLQIADRIEALNEEALRRGHAAGRRDSGGVHHIPHPEAGRRGAAAPEGKRPFASQSAGTFGAAGAGTGRRAPRFVARAAR